MRRSDLATLLFLLSGFVPVTASAQQTTPDTNQSSSQAGPDRTPQQSGANPKPKTPQLSRTAHLSSRTNPATEIAAAPKTRGSIEIGRRGSVARTAWTWTACVSARWDA
ncbi:hypothetical protein ACVWWK_001449 [Bradyrhizobium sp. LB9.1b]